MTHFDRQKFVNYLRQTVSPKRFGEAKCAKHVRLALASAGLRPVSWPELAKHWGGTLLALGFKPLLPTQTAYQLGDIAVIQPTEPSGIGHIEGYDGAQWISDFVQTDFWPSRAFKAKSPAFVVYRRPD